MAASRIFFPAGVLLLLIAVCHVCPQTVLAVTVIPAGFTIDNKTNPPSETLVGLRYHADRYIVSFGVQYSNGSLVEHLNSDAATLTEIPFNNCEYITTVDWKWGSPSGWPVAKPLATRIQFTTSEGRSLTLGGSASSEGSTIVSFVAPTDNQIFGFTFDDFASTPIVGIVVAPRPNSTVCAQMTAAPPNLTAPVTSVPPTTRSPTATSTPTPTTAPSSNILPSNFRVSDRGSSIASRPVSFTYRSGSSIDQFTLTYSNSTTRTVGLTGGTARSTTTLGTCEYWTQVRHKSNPLNYLGHRLVILTSRNTFSLEGVDSGSTRSTFVLDYTAPSGKIISGLYWNMTNGGRDGAIVGVEIMTLSTSLPSGCISGTFQPTARPPSSSRVAAGSNGFVAALVMAFLCVVLAVLSL